MNSNNVSRVSTPCFPTQYIPSENPVQPSQEIAQAAPQKFSLEKYSRQALPPLPNEIALQIFDFLSHSLSTPKDFIELMLISPPFCGVIRSLLATTDTYARSIWSQAQEKWSGEKIDAITRNNNTLTEEEIKYNIEKVIENIQHVHIKISSMGNYDIEDSNIILHAVDIHRFFTTLQAMENKQNLESLYFDAGFIYTAENSIIDRIIQLLKSCRSIRETKFSLRYSNFIAQNLLALGPEIKNTISSFEFTRSAMFSAPSFCSSGDIQPGWVKDFISNFTQSTISDLRLEGVGIRDEDIKLLIGILPISLKVLSFGGNDIGDEGVKSLSMILIEKMEGSYLYKNFQKLDLYTNRISHVGIQYILKILEKGIYSLNICYNNIGDVGVNNLMAAIPYSHKINFMDIRFNGAQPLPDVERRNKDLESVYVMQDIEMDDG